MHSLANLENALFRKGGKQIAELPGAYHFRGPMKLKPAPFPGFHFRPVRVKLMCLQRQHHNLDNLGPSADNFRRLRMKVAAKSSRTDLQQSLLLQMLRPTRPHGVSSEALACLWVATRNADRAALREVPPARFPGLTERVVLQRASQGSDNSA